MKKVLAIALLTVMVLSMVACTPKNAEAADPYAGTFRVGFGEALINPRESVPLAGYGRSTSRMSQNITEDLYVQCVALTDEQDNTVLIFSADAIRADDALLSATAAASADLNVPYDNVILNVSHSHSSPDLNASSADCIVRHSEYVTQQVILAGRAAMEDRKPAQMYYGSAETEGLNFIRHYLMDDGSYGGDSFGDWDNHYAVGHTAQPDTTIHLLKFTRDGGKDIVLANWRAHAAMTGSAGNGVNVSSDFLGPFRDSLDEMANCHSVYLQGYAGNINPGSRIKSEVEYSDYREHGYLLATFAYQGLQDMELLDSGLIRTKRVTIDGKINHEMDYMQAKAAELSALWGATGDREQVIELGKPYGIRSPYHAGAIRSNAKRGESEQLQLNVIGIGDSVGFTTGPAELFDRNSMAIEEGSPFEHTLCLAYTNGHLGYIPAAYVWEYTSYETDTSRFVPGTAEQIQDTLLQMLDSLE